MSTTKWPEEKYAVKIAENLGYRADGKQVTYKKYLEDFATHIENSTKLAESKAIVEDIAQRFVKVGFPPTLLQLAWYSIYYNINMPFSGQGVLPGYECTKSGGDQRVSISFQSFKFFGRCPLALAGDILHCFV